MKWLRNKHQVLTGWKDKLIIYNTATIGLLTLSLAYYVCIYQARHALLPVLLTLHVMHTWYFSLRCVNCTAPLLRQGTV